MLSHHAYLSSARYFAEEMVRASVDDTLYTTLPLFHINAQAHTVLPAIHLGATMAIGARFSASGFWDEVRRHGATIFNSLAAMIPILCKQPPGPGDRAHGARLTACAATPRDVWREFEQRFGVRIVEGYGLTETAGFCVANPLEATRVGSIGRPMGFVEARVVGPDGRALPPGQIGEIALRARAPHVLMEGYYRNPEATAQAFRADGFHTGDLTRFDDDGYLFLVGRMKDMIKSGGISVYPEEIEELLNAHPAVLENAVIGVADPQWGEAVHAFVVLRPGARLGEAELIAHCRDQLAHYKAPKSVVFGTLPTTATGKIQKFVLRERAREM
jgi:crotonobetaine/carnitine-CoA ligase